MAPKNRSDRELIASWLDSLTKDELAAEILELVDDDRDLRGRFALKAVRDAVQNQLVTDGYVGYAGAAAYARYVRQAAEAIDALVDAGPDIAAQAIGLAREAFGWFNESFASADDPSGTIGDAAHYLFAVHLRACQAAQPQPDPVGLGTYLADLILFDDYGLTPDLEDYTSVLGRAGTVAIRDRIDAVHKADPDNWNARQLTESLRALRGSATKIDALLDDGDLDAAWTAAKNGATQDQRIRLADASVTARPADALAVYLKAVEPLTKETGDDVYRQLARLLVSARACHEALGTQDEFRRYMTDLRTAQKRKRNLMKILTENAL
jgi:hypothetical protein